MYLRIKILVVDDESRMRKLVRDFLEREGYVVLEAGNGEEAIYLEFVSHPPDCLNVIPLFSQLAPQFLHVCINRPCIPKIVIIPHIVQYLLSGERKSLVLHKI